MNRGCLYKTKKTRFSWSGLWLLIMLLYSDVVYTSLSILNCPMLTGYDGKRSLVVYLKCMITKLLNIIKVLCACIHVHMHIIYVSGFMKTVPI